jgi:hypothetical protein
VLQAKISIRRCSSLTIYTAGYSRQYKTTTSRVCQPLVQAQPFDNIVVVYAVDTLIAEVLPSVYRLVIVVALRGDAKIARNYCADLSFLGLLAALVIVVSMGLKPNMYLPTKKLDISSLWLKSIVLLCFGAVEEVFANIARVFGDEDVYAKS